MLFTSRAYMLPIRHHHNSPQPSQRVSWTQRWMRLWEPHVPLSTIVNEGVVYLALAVWAGWQSSIAEPTLPLGGALAYAVWKVYDKRTKRNPEGPFWGGSALWGALLTCVAGVALGGSLAWLLSQAATPIALPAGTPPSVPFAFLLVLFVGVAALYVR